MGNQTSGGESPPDDGRGKGLGRSSSDFRTDDGDQRSSNVGVPTPSMRMGAGSPFSQGTPNTPNSLTDRVRAMVHPRVPLDQAIQSQQQPGAIQELETVPTAFKWSLGGERVFVTGSFNNWQGKIMMHPNEDNKDEFVLIIDIPPGCHQYKFIVDEKWRLNPNAPTVVVQGVVNNVVEVKRPVFELSATDVPFDDSDDDFDEFKRKLEYGQSVPPADAYTSLPQKMPPHLRAEHLAVNADINKTDPYVLPIPQHVTLNHLCMMHPEAIQASGSLSGPPTQSSDKRDVIVTSITQRFKTKPYISVTPKFVTLVYYRPATHRK